MSQDKWHSTDENRNTWERLKKDKAEQQEEVYNLRDQLERAEMNLERTQKLIAPFDELYKPPTEE